MQVTVAVPTYKTRSVIFKLLDSLKAQSLRNFNVMMVYKQWPGWKDALDRVKDYKGLDIALVKQDSGLFEEALNTIYRKADGDIVIHTDDDAHASKHWIKDHVELHSRYKKVGIATGMVEENTFVDGTPLPFFKRLVNEHKWRMNKHTLIDRPIDERFKEYGMYIGKSGMLVDTGKRHNMIRTFKQHGVNMSWKREALHGFKLPGYTKQGGRNEAAAALEVLDRRLIPVWFDKGTVQHPLQKSDSRNVAITSLPQELTAESVAFSYYVSKKYTVDLNILKVRTLLLDNALAKIMTASKNKGYIIGYGITKKAISERWPPKQVRKALINALSTNKVIY